MADLLSILKYELNFECKHRYLACTVHHNGEIIKKNIQSYMECRSDLKMLVSPVNLTLMTYDQHAWDSFSLQSNPIL